jgi:hypothetical protein
MYNGMQMIVEPKGPEAARVRQAKFDALRRFSSPPDLVGGSLCLTHRRCGKPNCHCAEEQGHPIWFLTFMAEGKRHVEQIPPEWVDEIRPLVEAGREFKDAVATVLSANARLLALARKQQSKKR